MTKTQKTSKTTLLRQLLERDDGASLAEICSATGWQVHSARAALTGLRKGGTTVERVDGQPTRWRTAMSIPTADTPSGDADPLGQVKA